MTIMSLLNMIASEEVVLPAIQRDFVWDELKTEKLLDSVMRGYPIGLALLWETYEDVQYRVFTRDYRAGQLHSYRENSQKKRLKVVLDGQQRLQSLYIALYGTREGTSVYLDVLSGASSDDVAEERYLFYHLSPGEAEEQNDENREQAAADEDRDYELEWLVPVSDLFAMDVTAKKLLVRQLTQDLSLTEEESLRLDVNITTLDEVLTKNENILRVSTIDEALPANSQSRKSEADVLEIFVRVNREGVPLSRSDLIFSMLKLNWKESAEALPEFVNSVNEGNSLEIDADFVIRSLFAVSDLGSRMDLDLLRRKSNVQKLQGNFESCQDAIRSLVDFTVAEGQCSSSSLLGGINTLVPFVYFLHRSPKHEVANKQVDDVRTALYLFALARPFSRYADSRIGSFIKNYLRPQFDHGSGAFPLGAAISEVRRWERVGSFNDLAQRNVALTLHLVQGLTGAKVQYHLNSPEVDHIFPRAELRKKGIEPEFVNHFANFWILAKGKNRNKSNKHPKAYFEEVSDSQMKRALIPREMLDYRRYNTFLQTRREAMLSHLQRRLQLSEGVLVGESNQGTE